MSFKFIMSIFLFLRLCSSLFSDSGSLYHIYIESDRTHHLTSARAIEMGIKTAFDSINNQVGPAQFKFIILDHRGNTVRSKLHLSRFLEDPKGLVFFGGLHSPPYITYRDYINKNKIPLLISWAAGGPITRYPSSENYVFRLSVDDTKAGEFIASTVKESGYKRPFLVLEKTPWGKSNYDNISKHIKPLPSPVGWFDWNIKESYAQQLIETAVTDFDADVIIFVGNAQEGRYVLEAAGKMAADIPIISHWGITGGNFFESMDYKYILPERLRFIQTKFNFNESELSARAEEVLNRAKRLFSEELETPKAMKAQTGFVHSYDLSLLCIASFQQLDWSKDIIELREDVKVSLENLEKPVEGLIKTYIKPFSVFSKTNTDAHEALGLDVLRLGGYLPNGTIKILD